MRGFDSRPDLEMKIPPEPKTPYVLDKPQGQRIFRKLKTLSRRKWARENSALLKLFYTQLETDWRTPLEKFIDKLLK